MSTYFQDSWQEDTQFKTWVARDPKDTKSARCRKCKVSINLSNMGKRALLSHMEGKKHKDNVKAIACFFQPVSKASSEVGSDASLPPSAGKKQAVLCVADTGQVKAEIYWALHVVSNSLSLNSNDDMNMLFQKMFPDSELATTYQMARTKLAYVINFGLAKYFHGILVNEIRQAPFLSVSFDESLNDIFQNCQMDLIIRYWSEKKGQVEERYYDSKFLGHPTANNILCSFDDALKDFNKKCLIQVSMDGPSTNWCFYNLLCNERENEELPKLVNIGSCGLHIIHGAFSTGAQATKWNMKGFLKSCYVLFHDSPARRADYSSVTGSDIFPLSFCSTRWIEDKKVADRLIDIWQNIEKMVKFWEGLTKSKRPKCKSYEIALVAVKDNLSVAKLQFFSYIASILQPFLTKYQTSSPMIPYYHDDLMHLIKTLMGHIVKPDVVKSISSCSQLQKFDFSKTDNMLPTMNVSLGFAAEKTIKYLKSKDVISLKNVKCFINDCCLFIISLLEKLFERGLVGSAFIKSTSIINPENIVKKSPEAASQNMKQLLHQLLSVNRITANQCDKALQEFAELVREASTVHCGDFKNFDRKLTRLDHFYFEQLKINSKYKNLSEVFKLILTLNHGQAAVERGFSINSTMLLENMKELSLTSRRKVKDYLVSQNLKPYEVDIVPSMLQSVKSAHSRYRFYLEDEKQKKEKEKGNVQLSIVDDEIADLKLKRKLLHETCEIYNKEFVDCAKKAGELNDLVKVKAILSKGNDLKRKAEENERELCSIDSSLKVLLEKRKCISGK